MQNQNYDKPAYQDLLLSHVIRNNFQSLASLHSGDTPPNDPLEGMPWLNTAENMVYQYINGAWEVVIYAGTKNLGRVLQYTLTQNDVNHKYIQLPWIVVHPEVLCLIVVGAPPPKLNVDYAIDNDHLRWDTLMFDGLLREGDELIVTY